MTQVAIRAYRPADRPLVRRICCETGDRGGPVDSFFWDRELFADLLTLYYTDHEPTSLWVAEIEGRPVGYLSGCLSTPRQLRMTRWPLAPRALVRALLRPCFWSRACFRFLWLNLPFWLGSQAHFISERYPAHLHVNLLPDCRGLGVGTRLVETFLEQARADNREGVHASVREDNTGGRRFFERLGFAASRTLPVMRLPATGALVRRVVYGRALS